MGGVGEGCPVTSPRLPPAPHASQVSRSHRWASEALTRGLSRRLEADVLAAARLPHALRGLVVAEEVELGRLPIRQRPRQHHPGEKQGREQERDG